MLVVRQEVDVGPARLARAAVLGVGRAAVVGGEQEQVRRRVREHLLSREHISPGRRLGAHSAAPASAGASIACAAGSIRKETCAQVLCTACPELGGMLLLQSSDMHRSTSSLPCTRLLLQVADAAAQPVPPPDQHGNEHPAPGACDAIQQHCCRRQQHHSRQSHTAGRHLNALQQPRQCTCTRWQYANPKPHIQILESETLAARPPAMSSPRSVFARATERQTVPPSATQSASG